LVRSVPRLRTSPHRYYAATLPRAADAAFAEAAEANSVPRHLQKIDPKVAATRYNANRAQYRRAVSKVRKQYQDEIAEENRAKAVQERTERAHITRKKLERQRLRNIRSVQNAIREEEKRKRRHLEFQKELAEQAKVRRAKDARFRRARQLLIAELEEEAPLWMTTPEEVDRALDNTEATQYLWGVKGGIIGAPAPSDDAEYWKYECHTMDMGKTYTYPKELLYDQMQDMAYDQANLDPTHWTEERIAELEEKHDKAKLRAMVREAGRKSLLNRQRQMLQDQITEERTKAERTGDVILPKPAPVPSLSVLANYSAQEIEGVKILNEYPERIFQFDEEDDATAGFVGNDEAGEGKYTATKKLEKKQLGKPLGLRDPIRDPHGGYPYPLIIGREPPKDTRTEREKKREEREEKMFEAARAAEDAAKEEDGTSREVINAAEDNFDDGTPAIDYNEIGNRNDILPSDKEYFESVDPSKSELYEEMANMPRDMRYIDSDLDWVTDKLSERTKMMGELIEVQIESLKQEKINRGGNAAEVAKSAPTDFRKHGYGATVHMKSTRRMVEKGPIAAGEAGATEDLGADKGDGNGKNGDGLAGDPRAAALGDGAVRSEGVDSSGKKFVQYELPADAKPPPGWSGSDGSDATNEELSGDDIEDLDHLLWGGFGGPMEQALRDVSAVMNTLSKEQKAALEELESTLGDDLLDGSSMSREDIETRLKKVPDLREDQIRALVDLELKLESNEAVRRELLEEGEKEDGMKDRT